LTNQNLKGLGIIEALSVYLGSLLYTGLSFIYYRLSFWILYRTIGFRCTRV